MKLLYTYILLYGQEILSLVHLPKGDDKVP